MKDLLLLHGAIGAADLFAPLTAELNAEYKVHTLNFPGHGGIAMPDAPFSIALFADTVLLYMKEMGLDRVSIFGYSMGGYVAMYLAKHHPDKVDKIITLATKYHWDEAIAAREVKMLDAETIELKVPAFACALEKRHLPVDWKLLMQRTAETLMALGVNNTLKLEDYTEIKTNVLVMLGDRDKMVSLDETVAVYKSLHDAQLCILPQTPHPIEQVDVKQLAYQIQRFVV